MLTHFLKNISVAMAILFFIGSFAWGITCIWMGFGPIWGTLAFIIFLATIFTAIDIHGNGQKIR